MVRYLLTRLNDLLPVLLPDPGHALQYFSESGHVIPPDRWEISATVKRLSVRRQEQAHRPAALPGHRGYCAHVDIVQVRPLFPVDLDIDKMLIHQRSDLGILEGFVRHNVAPVAS